MEQAEKSYDLLNEQYRHLQNDIAQTSENRLRQEHEFKQMIDAKDRKIIEIKNENTLLQDELTNM